MVHHKEKKIGTALADVMRQSGCEMQNVEPITLLLKDELSVFHIRVKHGPNVGAACGESTQVGFTKQK